MPSAAAKRRKRAQAAKRATYPDRVIGFWKEAMRDRIEATRKLASGANNIFDCYDITDERSVALWDRHLSQGKAVRGMGNTDAHLPQALGDVWNGVLIERPTKRRILRELRAGHFFASDGPLIHVRSGRAVMGDTVRRARGSTVEIRYECVDSLGLQLVRVVENGRVVREEWPKYDTVVKGAYRAKVRGGRSYVRVECFARDNRKAFANPIYLHEA